MGKKPLHHTQPVSRTVMVMTTVAFISVVMLSRSVPRAHGSDGHHHHSDGYSRRMALENVASIPVPPTTTQGPMSVEARAQYVLDNLKNGTDFFSDYEIKVVEEPELIDPAKKYFFHYPDRARVKYPYKMLSKWPRIYMFPEFITDEEADAMIQKANASMKRSLVDQKENGGISEIRTSSQTWLDVHSNPVAPIAARLRELTGIKDHENLQILRYEKGQRYGAHPDYLKIGGKNADEGWHSNRAATCYIYLSDVEEGGETSFPRADGRLIPRPWTADAACNSGLRVKPKRRTLVLFYDMTPEGAVDAHSLHAACPVKKGVKWGFTLWMHVNLNTSTEQPVVGYDF